MDILPSPQQLRYLIALAEQRHFGRAANVCSVTQSTLSAGILNLERQFDVSILDRTAGKRVVFTPIGEEVIAQAKTALQGLESVRDVIHFAQEPFSTTLKLGIIPTVGPYLLTSVIDNTRVMYPRLNLSIHEDLTDSLMEKLAIGFLDLLIIAMPCECHGVETYALFKDDFFLIVPKDHPLTELNQIPLQKIDIKEVIPLQDGHCLRDQTLDMCRQGQSFKTVTDAQNEFTASSLKTVINMVGSGLGIAFVPKMAIHSEIGNRTDIVIKTLEGNPTCRTIGLAWRRNSLRASEFKQFEKVFKNIKI